MKALLFSVILCALFYSCRKDDDNNDDFSEAVYRVELTGKWKAPEFGVPAGVHFTTFVGMVHNENARMWEEGGLASPGIENVAETGSATQALIEIDSVIRGKNASGVFTIPAPPPVGTSVRTIYANSNYTMVSFVSMIAPSPDWFVGINGVSLYNSKKWVADTLIQLYVHDAGTEEGDVFSLNNPASNPHKNIERLTATTGSVLANGNTSLSPIATVRFVRL
jgi:hypothetical protein